jgi:hypothetical protein
MRFKINLSSGAKLASSANIIMVFRINVTFGVKIVS